MQAIAEKVDQAAIYGQGLLADRPTSTGGSPGIQGRVFWATDVQTLYWDHGTGWTAIGPSVIADGIITEPKYATDSVSQRALANDSVGAPELIADSVGTSEIAPLAVTDAEIAAALKPSGGAGAGVEALRALGNAAGQAAPGINPRFVGRLGLPTMDSPTLAAISVGSLVEGDTVFVSDLNRLAIYQDGSWCLMETHQQAHQNQSGFVITNTSYTAQTETEVGRVCYPEGLDMYNLGWRPMLRINGFLETSSAGIAFAALAIYQVALNDTGFTAVTNITTPVCACQESAGAGVSSYEDSGYVMLESADFSPAPTEPTLYVVFIGRVSSGTGVYNNITVHAMWVMEPAP
jgi:hypothetical protein